MWNKPIEIPRLIQLRKTLLHELNGDPPLKKNITITLRVHVGRSNSRSIGDLDNFITGICDGLMAADSRARLSAVWLDPGGEFLHPRKVIAIVDDSEVLSIDAEKIIGDEFPWYSVELEGD